MTVVNYRAVAFKKFTVSSTALSLVAAEAVSAENVGSIDRVVIAIESNAVRYRIDGVANPTASDGMPIASGASVTIDGRHNIQNLKLIRQSSDATAQVTLYTFDQRL